MIFFKYLNKTIDRQISNIDENIKYEFVDDKIQSNFCTVYNLDRKLYCEDNLNYTLVVISYEKNITNKIFRRSVSSIINLIPVIEKSFDDHEKFEGQKTRRLKHNLITYTSKIQQELYNYYPQDSMVQNIRDTVKILSKKISEDTGNFSSMFMRILKSINLMKSEFDVYEILNAHSPELNLVEHNVHKILNLALVPFWIDFVEKDVEIEIERNYKKIKMDYKTISVALCHILENCVKYCLPSSKIEIVFIDSQLSFRICFRMISLRIEESERENIFKENFSGRLSKALNLSGTGLGMFIIEKIVTLNKGKIFFNSTIDKTKTQYINKIPYDQNELVIEFFPVFAM